jgi:hypothetical protein
LSSCACGENTVSACNPAFRRGALVCCRIPRLFMKTGYPVARKWFTQSVVLPSMAVQGMGLFLARWGFTPCMFFFMDERMIGGGSATYGTSLERPKCLSCHSSRHRQSKSFELILVEESRCRAFLFFHQVTTSQVTSAMPAGLPLDRRADRWRVMTLFPAFGFVLT